MSNKIRGWICKERLLIFKDSQAYSDTSAIAVSTYPVYHDDICIEMSVVDPTVQAKEADEEIKQIDEEMK